MLAETLSQTTDQAVVEPIKADAKRFLRIVRANAESVSRATATKLNKLADTIEAELREIESQ